MAYLVDSDWFIDYIAEVPEAIELVEQLAGSGVALSIVSYMESYEGVMRSPDSKEARERLERVLEGIPILPFSPAVARRCASLRERLRKEGKRVNPRALDLIIAATAIEHDLTLVTRNFDDYKDIPTLQLHSS